MLRGAVNRCYEIRAEHASVVRLIQRNTMGTFRPQITVACTPVTGITLILSVFVLRSVRSFAVHLQRDLALWPALAGGSMP